VAKPPTIRSLALLAGFSKATISLALRDSPRIRQSERVRIQKLAAETGYERNALMAHLLAQLRSGEASAYHGTLGLVCATKTLAELVEVTTFSEWFTACRARSKQLGYTMDEILLYEPGMNPARLVQILDTRNIRGLVVAGPFAQSVIPPEFDPIWRRSAAVVIGTRPVQPALSCAANDQFSTAKQAVWELRKLGYKRPGLCISLEIDAHVEARFQGGFAAAQASMAIKDRLPVFAYRPRDRERFVRWVKRWRPDSIVTLHSQIKEWVESMRLAVPGDLALAHLDRVPDLDGWAGMRQNNESVGYAAIDMVIGQLHRNEIGVPPFQKCTFTNSIWVPGATVRKMSDSILEPSARAPVASSILVES
jgi:DNA-binding LacI/PurR family transcriptional regulator